MCLKVYDTDTITSKSRLKLHGESKYIQLSLFMTKDIYLIDHIWLVLVNEGLCNLVPSDSFKRLDMDRSFQLACKFALILWVDTPLIFVQKILCPGIPKKKKGQLCVAVDALSIVCCTYKRKI